MSNWIFNGEEVLIPPEGYVGFVYIIVNLKNNRQYIGQKIFWNKMTRKPLKGKINKRRSLVESDWKIYFGSSEELKRDIILQGEDTFSREIVRLCICKSEMNYFETKLQFQHDVLFNDNFYNGIINCRMRGSDILKKAVANNP